MQRNASIKQDPRERERGRGRGKPLHSFSLSC